MEHTLVEFLHHVACLSQAVGLQADRVEVHVAGPLVVDVAHGLETETFAGVSLERKKMGNESGNKATTKAL